MVLSIVLIAAIGTPLGGATVREQSPSDRSYRAGTPSNNTTVPHENPARVDDNGNVSELQGWLSSHLSETLVDCSDGLSVGNYNACSQSENYPEWLSKYVNVTRKSDSDTNKTTAFERTRENQTEYANDVRRFRKTVDQYRSARQNGSTQRAKRLARRAQRIARNVNETSSQLIRGYRTIGNGTPQNLSSAVNATNVTTQNVTTVAETISIKQFKNTTISARAADRRISFVDPLRVSGRLTTANGTPLEDRRIVLDAGDQRRRTTTDASGRYSFVYRPTLLPLDTNRIAIRYRPTTGSIYRGNRTSVPVTVRQVQPKIQARAESRTVSFGDPLSVTGRVTVNETGVRSVPLAVTIDGRELQNNDTDRARTAANGRFNVTRNLSADVAPGRQPVRVTLPIENRAIGSANTSFPVTVASTPTALALNATQQSVNGSDIGGPVVTVNGTLVANGIPVRNRSVTIELNDSTTNVMTDENGSYVANITVPKGVFAGKTESVQTTIVAKYDGAGTNLDSSRQRTSIQLTIPTQTKGFLERFVNAFAALPVTYRLLIGLGVLFLLGYAVHRLREWLGVGGEDDSTTEHPSADDEEGTIDRDAVLSSYLEMARDRLSTGDPAGAIGLAYTAVRKGLQRDLDPAGTRARTHWEFFDAYRDRESETDRRSALRRLTERYERARFSRQSLSSESASSALDDARTVTDEETTTTESNGENNGEST